MLNNINGKSSDPIFTENVIESQKTENKSQKKLLNLKTDTKETENLSNNNSEEELIRNKIIINNNELELSLKQKISNFDNNTEKKDHKGMSISPIKKGRKKSLLLNMEKKNKNNRKSAILGLVEIKDKNEIEKIERKDAYGVPINRRNRKKIKVTFSDTLNSNNSKNANNQLAEIIPIASYKKYNIIEGIPKEENHITNKATCKCCLIF